MNALVIRGLYRFLVGLDGSLERMPQLSGRSGKRLIAGIGAALDLDFTDDDFRQFVALESRFQSIAYGTSPLHVGRVIGWFLSDRRILRLLRASKRFSKRLMPALRLRLGRVTKRVGL